MALSRKDFLAKKPNVHKIDVDGFGEVFIKPFSGEDIKRFQEVKNPADLIVVCAALGVCNEKGEKLFDDEDLELLAQSMEFKHLEAITKDIMKISGLIDPKLQLGS